MVVSLVLGTATNIVSSFSVRFWLVEYEWTAFVGKAFKFAKQLQKNSQNFHSLNAFVHCQQTAYKSNKRYIKSRNKHSNLYTKSMSMSVKHGT